GQGILSQGVIAKVDELKNYNRLYFCSNKRAVANRNQELAQLTKVPCLDAPYRKPSAKILKYLDNPERWPLVVIGDKFLTDGLFAKNIGASFVKVQRLLASTDSFITKTAYLVDDFFYQLSLYLTLMRPWQWIKNLFIFAPLFFARDVFDLNKLAASIWAFVVFCLTASAVYLINDLADKKTDAEHPKKKFRPVAAGLVSAPAAGVLSGLLLMVAAWLIVVKVPTISGLMLIYLVFNLLYSFYLKKVAIFDLLLVSSFYLLRILAGGWAGDIFISRWLVLCVIFFSLFIVIGKRRAELAHLNQREVLRYYNLNFLDQLLTMSAGLTVVAYGIYSVLGVQSSLAVYSTLFVILGIFRYLFIIHTSGDAEYPEKLALKDTMIFGSVAAWLIFMYIIYYL
ncbi:MAG: UbiA prenyltransferase family protein, partial [Candidatus Komeilibacteria bacterium]|nr:UbiA prenyltransferase family protein [Candidatus Komeilibacteria bacterium]